MPRRNLVGLEVGDLKVVGHWFAETWACRCSCGREALVHADDLVNAQNALVWMQAGNAEATTSAGLP